VEPVERVIGAIRAGQPVLLPTDTVYGLCANPFRREDVERLYRLKRRPSGQPTAILFASPELLLEHRPELCIHEHVLRALLPGPFTLILPNPKRAYPWLGGERPETLGVRIPEVAGPAREVLARVGALAATSANDPGDRDARRVDDVPERIRAGCGAILDGGELPGTPSTVVDLSGPEPEVVREGAVSAADALERARAAVTQRE
jgi:L-threonylcarbamoyladenylate synthase